MPPKHSLESSPSRPFKRRHILLSDGTPSSLPVTPVKSTPYSYPYIPSTSSTPYPSCPSDSPSNPFGRKRTLAMSTSLPDPTPFGRHMPIRFQFFRHGMKRDMKGVYRIVQVPLSYTFYHLRSLIAFLFGGQERVLDPREDEEEEEGTGHLFEVRKNVVMYSKYYRPGTIKKSDTAVRLSSARDPYRYKQEWDFGEDWGEEEDEGNEEAENVAPEEDSEDDEEDEEVKWEAEEDFTLAHVWKPGVRERDDKKAIVYYHNSSSNSRHPTQVHISLYSEPLPRRKGDGNTPYVFDARGHVFLSPPPTDDDDDSTDDELDPYEENFKLQVDPDEWNTPDDAFPNYLLDANTKPLTRSKHDERRARRESSFLSTPGLVCDSSSPMKTPSSIFPSSPFDLQLRTPYIATASSTPAPGHITGITGIKPLFSSFPKYTPAPPFAQRKRMAYIQRRIERSKHKGRISSAKDKVRDKDRDEGKGKESGSGSGEGSSKQSAIVIVTDSEEEVDQLADDDEVEMEGVRGIDGERLTYAQAMEILSRDDDVEEV